MKAPVVAAAGAVEEAVEEVEAHGPAAGKVGVEGEGVGPLEGAGWEWTGKFTEEQEEEMSVFLRGSVSLLTADSYDRLFKMWEEFLWTWGSSKDVALVGVAGDMDKAKVVLLFVVHLHSVGCRREERVTEVLSAVRHTLTTRYMVPVAFLDLELLKKAKQACKRSPEEVRARQDEQEAHAILPLCREIVEAMRVKLWVNTSWDDFDGILQKAVWLGIGLGVDQGARPSSLCRPDGKKAKDHGLRNSRLVFEFADGDSRKAGPAMKGVQKVEVVGVRVKLSTHKAGVDSSAGVQVGCLASTELAGDLVEWAVHWADRGYSEEGGYFLHLWRMSRGERPKMTSKTVTGKELRGGIKAGCADFGLDTVHFSAKSMRKTMAIDQELTGASEEARNKRGRWSSKASTAAAFYSHGRAVKKGKEGEALTLVQLKGLAGSRK